MSVTVEQVLPMLKNVKKTGDGWVACCPAHNDANPSLGIDRGKNDIALLICRSAGCSYKSIIHSLGLENSNNRSSKTNHQYIYTDEEGVNLFRVTRTLDKKFYQHRWDGDRWVTGRGCMNGVRRVLYRLPMLVAANRDDWVFVCEGEKDVERLIKIGLVATTNPGGAGKWRLVDSEVLQCRRLAILPDNDAAGAKHARDVANDLLEKAAQTRIVQLDGLREKGDVSDWLEAGGTKEALLQIVEDSADYVGDENTVDPPEGDEKVDRRENEKESALLVRLFDEAGAGLFHCDSRAYAEVPRNGHMEVFAIRDKKFGHWLRNLFFLKQAKPPNAQGLCDALNALDAKALFEAPEEHVAVRIAEHEGAIFLDLCDDDWRCVRVDSQGWHIVDESPVKFLRSAGMLALPTPKSGGDVGELHDFVNVKDDDDWALLGAWLVSALSPRGPFPPLALSGEQGSAKSTTARVLRALVDPNSAPIRVEPRDARDLMISASHSWVLAFDNLSTLRPWLSDGLCRLATGGGFSTRRLFTDDGEVIFDAMRPVILNAIEEVATRPDLADRAISISLPAIPDSKRRTERGFWRAFELARPRILGALLDAVSASMRRVETTHVDQLTRMADFVQWTTAAEDALGLETNQIVEAYSRQRQSATETAIEASVIGAPITALVRTRSWWQGTASELLQELEDERWTSQKTSARKDWPSNARALSGMIRRLAPEFRRIGITVEIAETRTSQGRLITLDNERSAPVPSRPSQPSPTGLASPESPVSSDGRDVIGDGSNTPDRHTSEVENSRFQAKNAVCDGCDGRDGRAAKSLNVAADQEWGQL